MTNFGDLIVRLEKATGADRDLDGAIEVQARRFDAYRAGLDDASRALWLHNGPTVYDGNTGYEAAKVTASIDAALALVERCLPGWGVETTKPAGGAYGSARIYPGTSFEANGKQIAFGKSATVPLAIILALLSALDQKEENK